jgi:hypothetical protein
LTDDVGDGLGFDFSPGSRVAAVARSVLEADVRELVQSGLERLGGGHVGSDTHDMRSEVGGANRLGDLRVGLPQEPSGGGEDDRHGA